MLVLFARPLLCCRLTSKMLNSINVFVVQLWMNGYKPGTNHIVGVSFDLAVRATSGNMLEVQFTGSGRQTLCSLWSRPLILRKCNNLSNYLRGIKTQTKQVRWLQSPYKMPQGPPKESFQTCLSLVGSFFKLIFMIWRSSLLLFGDGVRGKFDAYSVPRNVQIVPTCFLVLTKMVLAELIIFALVLLSGLAVFALYM